MSSGSEEKDGQVIQESASKLSEPLLNLFKPRRVTNQVLWQCIFYIAYQTTVTLLLRRKTYQ